MNQHKLYFIPKKNKSTLLLWLHPLEQVCSTILPEESPGIGFLNKPAKLGDLL